MAMMMDMDALLGCLQAIPAPHFQALMIKVAGLFVQKAMVEKRLTQMESAFGPNIDGKIIKEWDLPSQPRI